mmetsp:Transcript_6441/g.15918  ORF Transcript_6441/g.15918 Transcript_6441/m.15918 type:complete len:312 (+) Transcript_6441:3760-4695(+)
MDEISCKRERKKRKEPDTTGKKRRVRDPTNGETRNRSSSPSSHLHPLAFVLPSGKTKHPQLGMHKGRRNPCRNRCLTGRVVLGKERGSESKNKRNIRLYIAFCFYCVRNDLFSLSPTFFYLGAFAEKMSWWSEKGTWTNENLHFFPLFSEEENTEQGGKGTIFASFLSACLSISLFQEKRRGKEEKITLDLRRDPKQKWEQRKGEPLGIAVSTPSWLPPRGSIRVHLWLFAKARPSRMDPKRGRETGSTEMCGSVRPPEHTDNPNPVPRHGSRRGRRRNSLSVEPDAKHQEPMQFLPLVEQSLEKIPFGFG